MSFKNNLSTVTNSIWQGTKVATITLSQRIMRLVSGFFVGLVLSIIVQEFVQSGMLMLVFFTILFTLIIYRSLRTLTLFQIFVFDVICILIAILLRMYILIAP